MNEIPIIIFAYTITIVSVIHLRKEILCKCSDLVRVETGIKRCICVVTPWRR